MEDLESCEFAAMDEALEFGYADLAGVAHVVGVRAATFGSPLQEVLELLERAYARQAATPAYDVVKAITLAWVETALVHRHDMSCEDPLTALSTLAHLRSRLGDLYRGAERDGLVVRESHALVVMELPRTVSTNLLDVSLDMLEAGEALRTVYSGDETISRVAPRRAAALVSRERTDRPTLELLRILVRGQSRGDVAPRLWIESPPRTAIGIGWLMTELAR